MHEYSIEDMNRGKLECLTERFLETSRIEHCCRCDVPVGVGWVSG